MQPIRAVTRRRLDQRLAGLEELVGPRPARGWIRAIRESLGMSRSELAGRMGVSASRVAQFESDEVDRRIKLGSLERAADAVGCTVCYVLVPRDSLEQMVRRQARDKAARRVTAPTLPTAPEDECELADIVTEQIEALAYELIDRRGLWAITYGGRAAQP